MVTKSVVTKGMANKYGNRGAEARKGATGRSTHGVVVCKNLMLVYLAESTTAMYAAATTQGPKQVSHASTGRRTKTILRK